MTEHSLTGEPGGFAEIEGERQLALCWCDTHLTWEWHWVSTPDYRLYGVLVPTP